MPVSKCNKPRIPSNYYVWSEPPDNAGEEALHFVSERRSLKLKGRAFAEFERRVIPLLDGRRTLEEIGREVDDVFALNDLEAAVELLAAHDLVEDGESAGNLEEASRLTPQLNYFHELGLNPAQAQECLRGASVTIFGMSGAGPALAGCLANSGLGRVRCVDGLPVAPTDLYLSSGFSKSDLGCPRGTSVQRRLAEQFSETTFEAVTTNLSSEEEVAAAAARSDYIASCLDAGQASLAYKLNRVCLESGVRWTSCALAGTEVIVGPTVYPRVTPCYLCYKMRVVACAGNPEDAFAFEKLLDQRKQDDSCRRENLAAGASLAANFLTLEIVRDLAGLSPVATAGKVIVFNLLDLSSTRHVVLRKPWCPACFSTATDSGRHAAARP